MPKWKKNAKEFTVSVNYNDSRGYQSSIPKPIMDMLGQPDTIKFVIHGNNVNVVPSVSTNTNTHKNIRIETSNKKRK